MSSISLYHSFTMENINALSDNFTALKVDDLEPTINVINNKMNALEISKRKRDKDETGDGYYFITCKGVDETKHTCVRLRVKRAKHIF
jgi:hypothetical protein